MDWGFVAGVLVPYTMLVAALLLFCIKMTGLCCAPKDPEVGKPRYGFQKLNVVEQGLEEIQECREKTVELRVYNV